MEDVSLMDAAPHPNHNSGIPGVLCNAKQPASHCPKSVVLTDLIPREMPTGRICSVSQSYFLLLLSMVIVTGFAYLSCSGSPHPLGSSTLRFHCLLGTAPEDGV